MKSDGIYNVRDFGAVGVAVPGRILKLEVLQHVDWFYPKTDYTVYELREGAELDSLGIQRAIDAAHADGGGTVVVPPGDYLIGPIRLRSNIELHLSPGARLWGSPVLEHYYGVRSESDAGLAAIPRGTGDLSGDGSGRPSKPCAKSWLGSTTTLTTCSTRASGSVCGVPFSRAISHASALRWMSSRRNIKISSGSCASWIPRVTSPPPTQPATSPPSLAARCPRRSSVG